MTIFWNLKKIFMINTINFEITVDFSAKECIIMKINKGAILCLIFY